MAESQDTVCGIFVFQLDDPQPHTVFRISEAVNFAEDSVSGAFVGGFSGGMRDADGQPHPQRLTGQRPEQPLVLIPQEEVFFPDRIDAVIGPAGKPACTAVACVGKEQTTLACQRTEMLVAQGIAPRRWCLPTGRKGDHIVALLLREAAKAVFQYQLFCWRQLERPGLLSVLPVQRTGLGGNVHGSKLLRNTAVNGAQAKLSGCHQQCALLRCQMGGIKQMHTAALSKQIVAVASCGSILQTAENGGFGVFPADQRQIEPQAAHPAVGVEPEQQRCVCNAGLIMAFKGQKGQVTADVQRP